MITRKLLGTGLFREGGIAISILGLITIFLLWPSFVLKPLAVPLFVFLFGKTKGDVLFSMLLLGFTVVLLIFGFQSILDGPLDGLPFFVLSACIFTILAERSQGKASLWSYVGLAILVYAGVPSFDFFDKSVFISGNETYYWYPIPARIVAAASIFLAFYLLFKRRNLRAVATSVDADGARQLKVWIDTQSYATAMFAICVPAYFITFLLSDPNFFSSSFGLIGLIGIAVINASYVGHVLKQLSQTTILNVDSTGHVRIISEFNASEKSLDLREYKVESTELTHDPDPQSVVNFNKRNGSTIVAGGSGPEGIGMMAASTSMAAMEATGRLATGLTALFVNSQMNMQKKVNGWYMFIHLVADDETKRTIVLSRISKEVAEFLEEQLKG